MSRMKPETVLNHSLVIDEIIQSQRDLAHTAKILNDMQVVVEIVRKTIIQSRELLPANKSF